MSLLFGMQKNVNHQYLFVETGQRGTSPSVSDKNIIGMSEAIAAGQGTVGQFLLICLPRKG